MARPIDIPPPPEGPDRPVVLARIYPGYHEEATDLFQADAENLATHGYLPHGQSYAEGRWATWFLMVSAGLILVAIGVLLFLYMAAVRPPGSLAVTYLRRDAIP
jgi:hypothetical protein